MKELKQMAIILPNKTIKDYNENKLLTDNIINEIEEVHNLEVKKIYKNVLVKLGDSRPIEFDVLIIATTPFGQIRFISVELKEMDISKVIEQSIVRRDFVDYSYIVVDTSIKFLIQFLLYVWSDYVKEYKIGFFVDDTLILQSKFIRRKINIKYE